jgi:hypothetical protein
MRYLLALILLLASSLTHALDCLPFGASGPYVGVEANLKVYPGVGVALWYWCVPVGVDSQLPVRAQVFLGDTTQTIARLTGRAATILKAADRTKSAAAAEKRYVVTPLSDPALAPVRAALCADADPGAAEICKQFKLGG